MADNFKVKDNYGASSSDIKRGFCKDNVKDHEENETWMKEWEEEQAYRNIGFGRDTGNAR